MIGLSPQHSAATGEVWVPLTDEHVRQLAVLYDVWIDNTNEIRRRMQGLREAVAAGWSPSPEIDKALTLLNDRDDHFALKNFGEARATLSRAEKDAQQATGIRKGFGGFEMPRRFKSRR